jgi:CHAT domain-containing protein/tetratricopeptide (TPR) repeat protein
MQGDFDTAAASLGALHTWLLEQHGASHDVTRLVAGKLALVERRRGRESQAAALEAEAAGRGATGSEPRGEPDKRLERALKKLRACSTAALTPPKPEAPAPSVRERINLANRQYNEGKYAQARLNATDALASLTAATPARDRMDLHQTLALVNDQLGDSDDARHHGRRAEESAHKVGDAEVRIKMAVLLARHGALDTALQILSAVEGQASQGQLRAELAEARGDVALQLGSPREAAEQLDAALLGHRSTFGPNDPSTAAVLHRLGDAQRVAGDFPAALAAYEEALRIRRTTLGEAHPETAMTGNALGVLYGGLGDWQQADASFAGALAKLEPKLGSKHPDVLTLRSNRALAHWSRQKDAAAAAEYAAVVEGLEQGLGSDHPSVAAATRNLADMEFELGRAARAEKLVDRALAAQARSLGASHPDLAPTRLARAELLAHRGALPAAAAEVDLALEALLAARGAESPTAVHARSLSARIAAARGDGPAARTAALEASTALARYTRHTFGAISDRQRSLLAENAQDVVGALLSASSAAPREIFVALLPHRDSVLRSVAAGRAVSSGGELSELRRRYVAAVLGRDSEAPKRTAKLAARIDELEARAAGGTRTPERDPEEVLTRACKRLPADAALVKYVAYDATRRGGNLAVTSSYAALVVRGADCSVHRARLGDGVAIERAAEAFASAMRTEQADAPEARDALSKLIVTPLRDALDGASRWLVVPDGVLWGVPLGVLPDPEKPDRYLMERATIGYLTSTFELAEAEPAGDIDAAQLSALLIGAPEFGSSAAGGPFVLTDAGPCQLEPFQPLPATLREVEEVGSLLGEPVTLSGAGATKPALEASLDANPWLLHFATHAYFAGRAGCGGESRNAAGTWARDESPVAPNPLLLSGIVLAGANDGRVGSGTQQGILTAYEVSGLELRDTGLVVLSACDTGTGLQLRGQEVQGLRWGFRAAGARALVTSLWLSNDVATRRLMRGFYQALLSAELPADAFRGAEALRRAQLEQIEGERMLGLRRPLSWGNFVFSGML